MRRRPCTPMGWPGRRGGTWACCERLRCLYSCMLDSPTVRSPKRRSAQSRSQNPLCWNGSRSGSFAAAANERATECPSSVSQREYERQLAVGLSLCGLMRGMGCGLGSFGWGSWTSRRFVSTCSDVFLLRKVATQPENSFRQVLQNGLGSLSQMQHGSTIWQVSFEYVFFASGASL